MIVSSIEFCVEFLRTSYVLNDSFWQLDSMNLPAGVITVERVALLEITPTYQGVDTLASGAARYHTTSTASSVAGVLRFRWTADVPGEVSSFEMVSTANTTMPKKVTITAFDDATNTVYPQPEAVFWGNQNCATLEYESTATRSALNATSHETKTVVLVDVIDIIDDELLSWNAQQPLSTACVPVLGVDNQPTYGWVTLVQMLDEFNVETYPRTFQQYATPTQAAKFINLVAGLYSVTATPDTGIEGSPVTATLLVSERY